jgi:hypothetical protein
VGGGLGVVVVVVVVLAVEWGVVVFVVFVVGSQTTDKRHARIRTCPLLDAMWIGVLFA